MAEIFATVASGAGLASLGLQLLECAFKLKSFYETVENAPKALNRISREINTFALLLRQIEDTRARHGIDDSGLLDDSIQQCTESTQEIVIFTSRLDGIMRRYHAAGRIYSTLRMRDIQDICDQLERAKNSLMIAFQLFDHRTQVRMMDASLNLAIQQSLLLLRYGEAITQIREDTAMLRRRPLLEQNRQTPVEPECPSFGSSTPSPTNSTDLSVMTAKQVEKTRSRPRPYRCRIPVWFSQTILELAVFRSLGRWNFCLQTYNQQPSYSLVVAHYLAGRVQKVRELFQSGEASPYDVYGCRSPLELAVLSGSVEMFQFLQSCDFVDGHDVLERALSLLMSVWFEVKNVASSAIKTESSKQLLHIVEHLMNDQRIDIDQSYGIVSAPRRSWYCPSEILPLLDRNLTRPIGTLTGDEKLDFLDLRFSSNLVTPNLIKSIIPLAEALNCPSQRAAWLGTNPLDLISKFMGIRFKNCLSRSKETDIDLGWSIVSKDPTLLQLKRLLVSWIHFGCNLSGSNLYGFTPLQRFLHAQARWIRSTCDPLPIKYWANCISNAGLSLLEYGRSEKRAWKKIVRVAWRDDPLHDYNIRIWANGFEYGQDVDAWRLYVEQHTYVPIFRLEALPGSWSEAPFLPRALCWKPLTTRLENGSRWIFERDVVIISDTKPSNNTGTTSEYVRLLQDTQDDNIAAARLLEREIPPHGNMRRRNSEPSPLHNSKIRIQAAESKKPWLRGYFHYCPFCCERLVWQGYTCHRWNLKREFCSEERMWEGERLYKNIVRWKTYVHEHGFRPVECFGGGAETLVNPLVYHPVDAMDIFGEMEELWFCDSSPHCLHQRSYLDLLSQPAVDMVQSHRDVYLGPQVEKSQAERLVGSE